VFPDLPTGNFTIPGGSFSNSNYIVSLVNELDHRVYSANFPGISPKEEEKQSLLLQYFNMVI